MNSHSATLTGGATGPYSLIRAGRGREWVVSARIHSSDTGGNNSGRSGAGEAGIDVQIHIELGWKLRLPDNADISLEPGGWRALGTHCPRTGDGVVLWGWYNGEERIITNGETLTGEEMSYFGELYFKANPDQMTDALPKITLRVADSYGTTGGSDQVMVKILPDILVDGNRNNIVVHG